MKAGFTGGLVVDYPNSTKAKKFFLCLMTGGQQPLPAALGVDCRDDTPNHVAFSQKRYFLGLPSDKSNFLHHNFIYSLFTETEPNNCDLEKHLKRVETGFWRRKNADDDKVKKLERIPSLLVASALLMCGNGNVKLFRFQYNKLLKNHHFCTRV